MLSEKQLNEITDGLADATNKRGDKVIFLDFVQHSAGAPLEYIWKIVFASGGLISGICRSKANGVVYDEEGYPLDHLEIFRAARDTERFFNIYLTNEGTMVTQNESGHVTKDQAQMYGANVHANPGNTLQYLGCMPFTAKI